MDRFVNSFDELNIFLFHYFFMCSYFQTFKVKPILTVVLGYFKFTRGI